MVAIEIPDVVVINKDEKNLQMIRREKRERGREIRYTKAEVRKERGLVQPHDGWR